MTAYHDGMAAAYDALRGVAEPHCDWTSAIRAHREVQQDDKERGDWESHAFHGGIITVLAQHCTCQAPRVLYSTAR